MGFNVFIFERRENIKTSIDVNNYMKEFIKYGEEKDYNSLEGCSEIIVKFAKKMFEKFPSVNGEHLHLDEITFTSKNSETHLTDYSLGKYGVFCALDYSVADEAISYIISLADKYKISIYNPQSSEPIYPKDIEILKYRTEDRDDTVTDWNTIENSINTLDSSERGTSNRENAFVTVWFEKNGKDEDEYIQCTPNYVKKGFLNNLFKSKSEVLIDGYDFEIMIDKKLYQTNVSDKKDLIRLMKEWCWERKNPDVKNYEIIMEL